jgi:mono/diheme cytochrome c family protein
VVAASRAATGLLLVALLGGCGGGAPAGGEEPVDLAAGDAAVGGEVFATSCAVCHGPGGTGSATGPPLVHQVYVPSHHPDASFLQAVRRGVQPHHWEFGPMPPIGGLSDADVADVVAYVRAQQREAGITD